MSQQKHYAPQFNGFDHPFFPGSHRPYASCECGVPAACGNPHKAQSVGAPHAKQNKQAFSHWEGHAVKNDLNPKTHRAYQPPSLPYTCDRPMAGSQTCDRPMAGSQTCASASESNNCPP